VASGATYCAWADADIDMAANAPSVADIQFRVSSKRPSSLIGEYTALLEPNVGSALRFSIFAGK
jgi:hypothetical protein